MPVLSPLLPPKGAGTRFVRACGDREPRAGFFRVADAGFRFAGDENRWGGRLAWVSKKTYKMQTAEADFDVFGVRISKIRFIGHV